MQDTGRAGAILHIDLGAVRKNYRLLQAKLGRSTCGAAVKADAYGLGAKQIARVLYEEGCRHFFVAHLEEAIALRPVLAIDANLYVMHGAPIGYEHEFLQHNCIPVLNSLSQLESWRALAAREQRALPAVIQADTGMSRMGMEPAEVDRLLLQSDALQGVAVQFLMSHLACAEDQQHPMNARQLEIFRALRQRFSPQTGTMCASLANSSGIFLGTDYHFDLARPGAALYGVAPIAGQPNPMHAVAHLQGKIIQTRTIEAGAGVGYSLTYRASSRRVIATVAVGYADGWLRSLSNRGTAIVAGQAVPMVGNVSMDTITLDVSDIDAAHLVPGSLVDLVSAEQTVDNVARQAGTIGYEILTSMGLRYERNYIDAGNIPSQTGEHA